MKKEELSDLDLTSLSHIWADTTDGQWYCADSPETGLENEHGYAAISSPTWGCFIEFWRPGGNFPDDRAIANREFVVRAHRLVPFMIAEIGRLRKMEKRAKNARDKIRCMTAVCKG